MINKYLWYRFFILIFLTLVTANEVVFAQNGIIKGTRKSIGKNGSYVHPAILVKEIPTVSLPPRVRNKVITVETPLPTLPSMVERVSAVAELHTPFHGNTTPADLISIEEGRFISLGDLLKAYYPVDNLSTKLNPAQIAAVKRAVEETDKIFFTRGDQGQTIPIKQKEGAFDCEEEFERQLRIALEESNLAVTDFPWNFVTGSRGGWNSPLHHYLKTISLELYIYTYGETPSEIAKGLDAWIKRIKYNHNGPLPVQDIVINLYNKTHGSVDEANKDFLKRLQDFVAKNHRFPSKNASNPEEVKLSQDYYTHARMYPNDPSIKKALEIHKTTPTKRKYDIKQANEDFLKRLQDFVAKNHRFPSQYASNQVESQLSNEYKARARKYPNDPSIKKALEIHGTTPTKRKYDVTQTNEDFLKRLQDFVAKNHRFPSQYASNQVESQLSNEYKARVRKYPNDPSIKKALEIHGTTPTKRKYDVKQTNEDFLKRLQDFVAKNHRFPSQNASNRVESHLANEYHARKRKYTDDPSIKQAIEIKKSLPRKGQ